MAKMVSLFTMCGRVTLEIPPSNPVEIFSLPETPVFTTWFSIALSQLLSVVRQNADSRDRLKFFLHTSSFASPNSLTLQPLRVFVRKFPEALD